MRAIKLDLVIQTIDEPLDQMCIHDKDFFLNYSPEVHNPGRGYETAMREGLKCLNL